MRFIGQNLPRHMGVCYRYTINRYVCDTGGLRSHDPYLKRVLLCWTELRSHQLKTVKLYAFKLLSVRCLRDWIPTNITVFISYGLKISHVFQALLRFQGVLHLCRDQYFSEKRPNSTPTHYTMVCRL